MVKSGYLHDGKMKRILTETSKKQHKEAHKKSATRTSRMKKIGIEIEIDFLVRGVAQVGLAPPNLRSTFCHTYHISRSFILVKIIAILN